MFYFPYAFTCICVITRLSKQKQLLTKSEKDIKNRNLKLEIKCFRVTILIYIIQSINKFSLIKKLCLTVSQGYFFGITAFSVIILFFVIKIVMNF